MENPLEQTLEIKAEPIARQRFLLLLQTAVASKSFRFARQAAEIWLVIYPGDLKVQYWLANGWLGDGRKDLASEILEKICSTHPDDGASQALLSVAVDNPQGSALAASCAFVSGQNQAGESLPEWAYLLRSSRVALHAGNFPEAEILIHRVLGMDMDLPLAAIYHIRMLRDTQDPLTVYRLANLYHDRWPECLAFSLVLAEAQLNMGEETEGVNRLKQCAIQDCAGQVAESIWGQNHRYQSLWPDKMEILFDLPIPASVAGILGWNRLVAGELILDEVHDSLDEKNNEKIAHPDVREETVSVNDCPGNNEPIFELVEDAPVEKDEKSTFRQERKHAHHKPGNHRKLKISEPLESPTNETAFNLLVERLNKGDVSHTDGRFPMYVVLSTISGLTRQFGAASAGILDKEMKNLSEIIKKKRGWGGMVFYPDDPSTCRQLGLEVLTKIDPWKIKLALNDLDKELGKKGAMIGALLIVGGPEVVPFHSLPNPTDDLDNEVLSDNPYATLDANYFVPEWPVGRLPGESGPDAGLLLRQLRKIVEYHSLNVQAGGASTPALFSNAWWKWLLLFFKKPGGMKGIPSIGYTAAVWRRASLAAFRPVGEGQAMLVSPPTVSNNIKYELITSSNLGYFNLHGLENASDWYGQKDVVDSSPGPDYPVALSPKEIVKNGNAPKIIFSEACYGGHIINRTEQDAIALKFLSIGALGVVGSTCVAYGSVTTPLIGADLLGSLFWKFLREGHSIGEALLYAKVTLVQEMKRRQGFLDGEDQKTLLSFVLYGDPLAQVKIGGRTKSVPRPRTRLEVDLINDQQTNEDKPAFISREKLREVKKVVETYLPGLENAKVIISPQCLTPKVGMEGEDVAVTGGGKAVVNRTIDRVVITISKEVREAKYVHRHYARATLNGEGKLVKLSISR